MNCHSRGHKCEVSGRATEQRVATKARVTIETNR